jgi:hypothetical protein
MAYDSSTATTRLIDLPGDVGIITSRRETDVRTALTRGVAEYLRQLSIDWVGGRQHRFKQVLETWSEPENESKFPSACVYSEGEGTYDTSNLTPQTYDLGDSLQLRKISELKLRVAVEFVATDPPERMAIMSMLEDAFDPCDWRSGFVLELPHYHNVRASFEKLDNKYEDGPVVAQRRIRVGRVTLDAICPQMRFVGIVPKPDFRIDAGEAEGGQGGIGPDVAIE